MVRIDVNGIGKQGIFPIATIIWLQFDNMLFYLIYCVSCGNDLDLDIRAIVTIVEETIELCYNPGQSSLYSRGSNDF